MSPQIQKGEGIREGLILAEISPTDITTYVGAALALTTTAVLACLVPSLRAARVDPVSALREE